MAQILYVENHAVFAAHVTSQSLSQHEIFIVPGLQAARQTLKANLFDLILLDYDLDDGKGEDLLKELGAISPRPYVIAVSAHDVGNMALLKAGANEICGKLQFSKIASVVASALNLAASPHL